MNTKLIYLCILALGFAFTSCKKCADCACTNNVTYTYGDSIDQTVKDAIESATNSAFATQYPEITEEICERGGSFDDEKDKFEEQGATDSFENPAGGTEYSYEFVRSCVCTDN